MQVQVTPPTGQDRTQIALRTVAHELREPLTIVLGYSDMLTEEPRMPEVERYKAASLIHAKAKEMESLIGALLDVTRLEAGVFPRRSEVLHLEDVVAAAVTAVQPRAEQQEATIRVALPGALPVVNADPEHLVRILINLLHNALTYSPAPAQVAVLGRVGVQVELVVRDRGVGIPRADRHRIFEPFERVDGTMPDFTAGLGLGLSISRQLARLNGGELELEQSEPGQGSAFRLGLPPAGEVRGRGADVSS